MNNLDLFTAALMLSDPWKVTDVQFTKIDKKNMELHITIDFNKGGLFSCSNDQCSESLKSYDTISKTWRHLNFFQYKTYIHARVPRTKCDTHGVHMVVVPWSRPGSGFTMLFEAYVVELAAHLPVSVIASMTDEHDTRLWRFIQHYVNEARAKEDYSEVKHIGIDETSKKGHKYITVVVDLEKKKVIYVTDGKDHKTLDRFSKDFIEHQGIKENIKIITCDMSLGFKKGVLKNFKNSRTIIDKFHVIKHANEAVDRVRKEEAKTNNILKSTKYLWLKNESNLTPYQLEKKQSLSKHRLKTGRAYQMRIALQDIYNTCVTREEATHSIKKLLSWMMHSRLEHMKKLARTIRNHFEEIMNYFDYRYTNAILEGMNSIIQNIKRRARGFKNDEYFKTMIYLVCGKLDLATANLGKLF
jgi:transposase